MTLLKILHVLFVFMWIGSLLTLTRFLGYLSKENVEVQKSLLNIFRRFYFFIDLPSMVLTIVLGIILFIVKKVGFTQGWVHMKLTFTFLLVICDIITGRAICRLQNKPLVGKGTQYKILHALTALFLIGIIVSIYLFKPLAGA